MERTKFCKSCEAEKSTMDFNKHDTTRARLGQNCKPCIARRKRELRLERNPERRHRIELLARGMKHCGSCSTDKPLSEFWIVKATGLAQPTCKACMRVANAAWSRRNPEKRIARQKRRKPRPAEVTAAYSRAWREKNPDSGKRYYAANVEKERQSHRTRYDSDPVYRERIKQRWRAFNKRRPDIKNAIVARRRARQKNALVPWADKAKMREFYTEAKRRERLTGEKHHVDHVVPLQSPLVCGLHWEGNLQVLPATVNHAKLNRVWPDMPGVPY